jgi:hypothetical protein
VRAKDCYLCVRFTENFSAQSAKNSIVFSFMMTFLIVSFGRFVESVIILLILVGKITLQRL